MLTVFHLIVRILLRLIFAFNPFGINKTKHPYNTGVSVIDSTTLTCQYKNCTPLSSHGRVTSSSQLRFMASTSGFGWWGECTEAFVLQSTEHRQSLPIHSNPLKTSIHFEYTQIKVHIIYYVSFVLLDWCGGKDCHHCCRSSEAGEIYAVNCGFYILYV